MICLYFLIVLNKVCLPLSTKYFKEIQKYATPVQIEGILSDLKAGWPVLAVSLLISLSFGLLIKFRKL